MEQLHDKIISRRKIQLKIGIFAIVLNQSLAAMKRKGFQVMFMILVGSNHYSFGLDIVADDYAEFGCEKLFGVKTLRQLEQGVRQLYALQTVKSVNLYFTTVVEPEHIPAVLKQFYTIWLNRKGIAMLFLERTVSDIHDPVFFHRFQDCGQVVAPGRNFINQYPTLQRQIFANDIADGKRIKHPLFELVLVYILRI